MADCWVATGQESSLKKLKKATHGAVCASKIITWDQKTRAKSTQRFSSEEAQNASDQSAMWKCDLSSIKRKESMSMWRMLATCVTAASLAEVALEVKGRKSKAALPVKPLLYMNILKLALNTLYSIFYFQLGCLLIPSGGSPIDTAI